MTVDVFFFQDGYYRDEKVNHNDVPGNEDPNKCIDK